MFKKITILLGISLYLFTSCQQDEEAAWTEKEGAETYPVHLSLSLKTNLQTSHEYVPMKSEPGEIIKISNDYRIFVLKDIDGKWIFDSVVEAKMDPNAGRYATSVEVEGSLSYGDVTIELRPGTYRLAVFTGGKGACRWVSDLKAGDIVDDNSGSYDLPCVTIYNLGSVGWENVGKEALGEELFYGMQPLVVEKTEDLHTDRSYTVEVPMERRVAKVRILVTDDGNAEFQDTNLYINSFARRVNGRSDLPRGLNIWGEAWYDPNEPLEVFPLSYYFYRDKVTGSDNRIYRASQTGVRVYAPYIITGTETGIDLEFTDTDVTGVQGTPPYLYYDPVPLTISTNMISGFIFSNQGGGLDDSYFMMDLINEDTADKLPANYEYNP